MQLEMKLGTGVDLSTRYLSFRKNVFIRLLLDALDMVRSGGWETVSGRQ